MAPCEDTAEEGKRRDSAQNCERKYDLVLEPVIRWSFFEHVFERAKEERREAKPGSIEAPEQAEIGLVEIDRRCRCWEKGVVGEDEDHALPASARLRSSASPPLALLGSRAARDPGGCSVSGRRAPG